LRPTAGEPIVSFGSCSGFCALLAIGETMFQISLFTMNNIMQSDEKAFGWQQSLGYVCALL